MSDIIIPDGLEDIVDPLADANIMEVSQPLTTAGVRPQKRVFLSVLKSFFIDALAALVSINSSDISTNASDISTNASDISTNASDISTNTSDISDNTSDISTNTGNISTNTGDISTNASDISDNSDSITEIEENTVYSITTNFGYTNGWTAYDEATYKPKVVVKNGVCYMSGLVIPNTAVSGSSAFNIPVGLRPSTSHFVSTPQSIATYPSSLINLSLDGNVYIYWTTGSEAWRSISCSWVIGE